MYICTYCKNHNNNPTHIIKTTTKKLTTFEQMYDETCDHKKVKGQLTDKKKKYRTHTFCRYFECRKCLIGKRTPFTNIKGEFELSKDMVSDVFYFEYEQIMNKRRGGIDGMENKSQNQIIKRG